MLLSIVNINHLYSCDGSDGSDGDSSDSFYMFLFVGLLTDYCYYKCGYC